MKTDMPPRRPLQALDLQASFDEGSPGHAAHRLIDLEGKEKLDRTVWEAGLEAYNFLKDRCEDATSAEGYQRWVSAARTLVADEFYPHLLEHIEAGQILLESGSASDFKAAWKEYDWVERLDVFLRFVDGLTDRAEGPPPYDPEIFSPYAAVALLWRIDDAVIAEFLDGRGLSECVVDIVELRRYLKPRRQTGHSALDAARKHIGRAGAAAKLAKDPKQVQKAEVRECWASWQRQPTAYKSKAAFARDMMQKYESLESQAVIVRWCNEWERQQSAG